MNLQTHVWDGTCNQHRGAYDLRFLHTYMRVTSNFRLLNPQYLKGLFGRAEAGHTSGVHGDFIIEIKQLIS
jgi:hypothetical protein